MAQFQQNPYRPVYGAGYPAQSYFPAAPAGTAFAAAPSTAAPTTTINSQLAQPFYGGAYSYPAAYAATPYGATTLPRGTIVSSTPAVAAAPPTLHYWPVKARNYLSIVIAAAGGVKLAQDNETSLDSMKAADRLPFGQFPFLEDGDVKLSQSVAIAHYLAKKGGLLGEGADYARSEMMVQEYDDLYNLIAKANYSDNKAQAYSELFAETGPIRKHLGYIEKLFNAAGTGFTKSARPLLGDYAIAVSADFLVHLEPTCLDDFPKLKAFHAKMVASDAFKSTREMPHYFNRA